MVKIFHHSIHQIYQIVTKLFCPMVESIRNGTMNAIQNSFPSYTIHNNIAFDVPWTHEKISEESKEFLNQ